MQPTTAPDYSLVPDLLAYLADHESFESERVERLSGGGANFTFRLHLKTPLDSQTTLVLKHSKTYAALVESIPLAIERQSFEVEALRRVREWLPQDSMVTVPAVHHFDDDAHVVIMDDCGPASRTLKSFMLEGKITTSLAEEIGAALGMFLSALHRRSAQHPADVKFFDGHDQGKIISAWATYGRLVSTLSGQDNVEKLEGLKVSSADMDIISKVADEMSLAINSANSPLPLTMGDFWPGNILINLDADGVLKRINVVDWELVKPGLPGLDIGQFCGEMHQTIMCRPEYAAQANCMLSALLSAYVQGSGHDAAVARDALIHCGAHLVIWTPRTPWGDSEQTKEVVRQGVKFIVSGRTGSVDTLKISWVGLLV
ncbi:kinase-like domain-containing protein [Mycena crocata]|nr:kinase-like domain-containing protein [Mycena crocata]